MDPLVILTIIGISGLAVSLTLAVWRTITKPVSTDRFDEALAQITGTESFETDTTLSATKKTKKFTWSGYWYDLFVKSGRQIEDRDTPSRIMIGIIAITAFIGFFIFPGGPMGVAVPAVAVLLVIVWLGMETNKRKGNLEKQLPMLLSGLRAQMQAGMNIQGAIATVAKDLPSPLGDEIRQVRDDVNVSVPLETALQSLADRSQSRIMKFLVSSMGIAIRSGSDLIPQLVVIEETVRQRARIQGKIASALALAKPTAYIAMAAPVLLGGWMFISDPSYPAFYFSPDGFLMLLVALGLYVAGVVVVQIMVSNVEKV